MAAEGLPHRRWIWLDLPGHGDSPSSAPWTIAQWARDVLITLDALGVGEVDVVGHSLGALTAAELCKLAPAQVKSAVLLDPRLMSRDEFIDSQTLAPPTYDPRVEYETGEEALAARWSAFGTGPLPEAATPWALREEAARFEPGERRRLRLRADLDGVGEVFRHMTNEMPFSIGAFTGRLLLIIAGRSGLITQRGHEALRSELGARLTSVTLDVGHELLWEDFEKVSAEISVPRRRELVARGASTSIRSSVNSHAGRRRGSTTWCGARQELEAFSEHGLGRARSSIARHGESAYGQRQVVGRCCRHVGTDWVARWR